EEQRKIVVTSPAVKDVVTTQKYVCQIHSRRHIELRALEGGYLEPITIKEGQSVKQGEILFKILPVYYRAELDSEVAEAQRAQIEYSNTKSLYDRPTPVVSEQEVKLAKAKLDRANAKVALARAKLNFTEIKAPFDGIIDRLYNQQGSRIAEGDILTTVSDNDVMWVYFNVPEARYLEYMAADHRDKSNEQIELMLANGEKFSQVGKIAAIEADFNNETGNIKFRADFPNPDHLLRYGQTGTVLIHQTLKNAIVIPQRATFEILDKRYVYVVDKDNVIHQRAITIAHEMDDIFVIQSGLDAKDKFVLEGVRQVHDGEHIEYEYLKPEKVLSNMKYHAE
ncbi:MAG: efflux RND transporter periplasmic adaptor subunit, partial [Pirellulales bacterium]|nr:efflux RND transporter periplasmic adaptor subunit [Pirellulales bacterium]